MLDTRYVEEAVTLSRYYPREWVACGCGNHGGCLTQWTFTDGTVCLHGLRTIFHPLEG